MKLNGNTVVGENEQKHSLNQFDLPCIICINDNAQCIYVSDCWNTHIVQWKCGAENEELVAGGNGMEIE
jgi:hypothetical protein